MAGPRNGQSGRLLGAMLLGALPSHGHLCSPKDHLAARLITGRLFFSTLAVRVWTAFGHAEVHQGARDLS
jgi:hypothetical protein